MLDQTLSLFTVESRRAQFWVLSYSLFSLTILLKTLNCHVIKYAYDTVIYYANKDIDVIEKVLNLEMESVETYCRENELGLNLKKGKT